MADKKAAEKCGGFWCPWLPNGTSTTPTPSPSPSPHTPSPSPQPPPQLFQLVARNSTPVSKQESVRFAGRLALPSQADCLPACLPAGLPVCLPLHVLPNTVHLFPTLALPTQLHCFVWFHQFRFRFVCFFVL